MDELTDAGRTGSALARPRLLDLLAPIDANGFAVVVAPAGSGKTTVLDQWTASRGGGVRWYSLGQLPSPDDVLGDPAGAGEIPTGVVIDDPGLSPHSRTDEGLGEFIQRLAPVVPVILATRTMPALNFARYAFPRVRFVTAQDLAFRPWEVAALFSRTYNDPIGLDAATALADRTDGWAAALFHWQLARQMGPLGDPLDEPVGYDSLMRAYLNAEVLHQVDDQDRHLMRLASTFDSLTAEHLDRLLDTNGSHTALRRIAAAVDLVHVGTHASSGTQYRYHAVLRQHLNSELLDEVGLPEARLLQAQATAIARDLGDDTPEVLRHSPDAPPLPPSDPKAAPLTALRLLSRGQTRLARATLADHAPTGDPRSNADVAWHRAAQVGVACVEALVDPTRPEADLDTLDRTLRVEGLPWLRRLVSVTMLCRTGDARACREALAVAAARDRADDPWGAALIESVVATALLRHGRPDTALLQRLETRFRQLDESALVAWTTWRDTCAAHATQSDRGPRESKRPAPTAGPLGPPWHEVSITCFGDFTVRVHDQPVSLSGLRPVAQPSCASSRSTPARPCIAM
ncbi:hypothetical protein [Kribbia dieselivorans]|uniref:hypothetical protein n=1 Tax=Kribbia dieselivorans TaxID=331526 RepID=UPI000839031E|nr:hypothetical protein [Kribbia dieselivorans]